MPCTRQINRDGLVISDLDLDRLRRLAAAPHYRTTYAESLATLDSKLDRGTVVAPRQMPDGVVTMRSRVRIRDLRSRDLVTYTLVFPDEADIDSGRLSVLAPLGTALLGRRAGQVVRFVAPAGVRRVKLQQVLYQPESAGDYNL